MVVSFYVEAIFSRRFKRREIRRFNSFQVCRQNTGVREVVANLENTIAITNYSALLGGGGGRGTFPCEVSRYEWSRRVCYGRKTDKGFEQYALGLGRISR